MRNLKMLLVGAALALCSPAMAQGDAPPRPLSERLTEAALANRQKLEFDGATFSGPAFETLLAEGKASQFFLLGEDHGIAENPRLAGALFEALAEHGYSKFMIEVSPPIATVLDGAAKGGLDGLHALYAEPGGEPAFFGMAEEAELLVGVRAAVKGRAPALWGADYEVGGDRLLIARLGGMQKPKKAQDALAALKAASDASWVQFEETRNPQFIYSFSGDPALVRALRDVWPRRSAKAEEILKTLEETFEINRLWVAGKGFASNERRSAFMRSNFAAQWNAEKSAGRSPKIFAKFGASHLVRGRNYAEVYDLGAIMAEAAALEGGRAFHLLVLAGKGAQTARFNPSTWSYDAAPVGDDYTAGIEPLFAAAHADAFTLIDLRPLRPLLGGWMGKSEPDLRRVVHGFDAILILSGSTPSSSLSD